MSTDDLRTRLEALHLHIRKKSTEVSLDSHASADDWEALVDGIESRLRALLAATDPAPDEALDLRKDNADLARQLSDACQRRADAYDEGYDRAMQDAHYVLNQRGYLERRGDDNGNPYAAPTPPWVEVGE